MRLFELRRIEDESGVSGTGTVAQGIVFDNGSVALTWLTPHTSCAIYTCVEEVVAIHGHNGKTKVVVIADLDMKQVREHCINRGMDDIEGVSMSLYHAGKNERYMVEQRDWFADLFREVEVAPRNAEDGRDVLTVGGKPFQRVPRPPVERLDTAQRVRRLLDGLDRAGGVEEAMHIMAWDSVWHAHPGSARFPDRFMVGRWNDDLLCLVSTADRDMRERFLSPGGSTIAQAVRRGLTFVADHVDEFDRHATFSDVYDCFLAPDRLAELTGSEGSEGK